MSSAPAPAPEERRKGQRTDVDEPAYVSSHGSSTRCRLVNISAEGAAIEVPDPMFIPNRFQLMTERDRYITTITDGVVPYAARPFASGRYAYAPYTNSYGIPARVIIDPVDPAAYWRPVPYYASPPYVEAVATSYSCYHYGTC